MHDIHSLIFMHRSTCTYITMEALEREEQNRWLFQNYEFGTHFISKYLQVPHPEMYTYLPMLYCCTVSTVNFIQTNTYHTVHTTILPAGRNLTQNRHSLKNNFKSIFHTWHLLIALYLLIASTVKNSLSFIWQSLLQINNSCHDTSIL